MYWLPEGPHPIEHITELIRNRIFSSSGKKFSFHAFVSTHDAFRGCPASCKLHGIGEAQEGRGGEIKQACPSIRSLDTDWRGPMMVDRQMERSEPWVTAD